MGEISQNTTSASEEIGGVAIEKNFLSSSPPSIATPAPLFHSTFRFPDDTVSSTLPSKLADQSSIHLPSDKSNCIDEDDEGPVLPPAGPMHHAGSGLGPWSGRSGAKETDCRSGNSCHGDSSTTASIGSHQVTSPTTTTEAPDSGLSSQEEFSSSVDASPVSTMNKHSVTFRSADPGFFQDPAPPIAQTSDIMTRRRPMSDFTLRSIERVSASTHAASEDWTARESNAPHDRCGSTKAHLPDTFLKFLTNKGAGGASSAQIGNLVGRANHVPGDHEGELQEVMLGASESGLLGVESGPQMKRFLPPSGAQPSNISSLATAAPAPFPRYTASFTPANLGIESDTVAAPAVGGGPGSDGNLRSAYLSSSTDTFRSLMSGRFGSLTPKGITGGDATPTSSMGAGFSASSDAQQGGMGILNRCVKQDSDSSQNSANSAALPSIPSIVPFGSPHFFSFLRRLPQAQFVHLARSVARYRRSSRLDATPSTIVSINICGCVTPHCAPIQGGSLATDFWPHEMPPAAALPGVFDAFLSVMLVELHPQLALVEFLDRRLPAVIRQQVGNRLDRNFVVQIAGISFLRQHLEGKWTVGTLPECTMLDMRHLCSHPLYQHMLCALNGRQEVPTFRNLNLCPLQLTSGNYHCNSRPNRPLNGSGIHSSSDPPFFQSGGGDHTTVNGFSGIKSPLYHKRAGRLGGENTNDSHQHASSYYDGPLAAGDHLLLRRRGDPISSVSN